MGTSAHSSTVIAGRSPTTIPPSKKAEMMGREHFLVGLGVGLKMAPLHSSSPTMVTLISLMEAYWKAHTCVHVRYECILVCACSATECGV